MLLFYKFVEYILINIFLSRKRKIYIISIINKPNILYASLNLF